MEKFMKLIEQKLMPVALKVSGQRHMQAVRQGVMSTLPLTIVGSFFCIFMNLPIDGYSDFIAPYLNIVDVPYRFTVGILSLYAAYGIGASLARYYKLDTLNGGLLATIAFLVSTVVPTQVTAGMPEVIADGRYLTISSLSASSLFGAIVTSLIAVEIYRLCKIKNITIKMPDGVPPEVSNSFAALFPAAIVIILFWVIRYFFNFDISATLSNLLMPLKDILSGNSLFGGLLTVFLITFFWVLGIHGPAIMSPVMYMIMYCLTLGIYFIGAYLIENSVLADKITVFGNMVVFSSYAMQVIMSFLMLAMIFMILPRAQVSANRINEVLDTKESIKEGTFDGKTKEVGTVEFKNVSFRYPDADEYLLRNISFKANKGETVAFIGSTGSGKSTLINLIPRFYDATDGEVLVDGVNVKDYKEEALNNKLGYVPQKAVMFNGTVNYNIAYGDNGKGKISEKKIQEAAKVAQASEFIEKMDDKYETQIAQGGTNVSGGQKQRLAIARAIARDPEIYIFDDSFSALDYKTDSVLRRELKNYTKNATSLIVAQRIGTIMNADKIIVLDSGKCVGMGTHKELLKNCEVYKKIALSQLSKEELEREQ